MKKNIFAISLFILGWTAPLSAEVMTYQGRLKESNVPVNANRTFLFELCATETPTGCVASADGARPFEVQNGLFKSTFTLPAVDLSAGPWYLRVKVEGSYLLPVERLTFVPYSVFATSAAYAVSASSLAAASGPGVISSTHVIVLGGLNASDSGVRLSTVAIIEGYAVLKNINPGAEDVRVGVSGRVNSDSTDAVDILAGGNFEVEVPINRNGAMIGVRSAVRNSGSSSLAVGLLVDSLNNTGTIGDTYGVWIATLTAGGQTNKPFAIFSEDPNARSYFAGNVGISSRTPAYALSVSSASGDLFWVAADGAHGLKFWGDGSGLTGVTGASGTDSTKVLKAGDTMTGYLDIQGARLKIIADTATNQYSFAAGTGTAANQLYVSTGGNVGIGLTNPSTKLTLPYNGYLGWDANNNGDGVVVHRIGKATSGATPLQFLNNGNPGPAGRQFSFLSQGAEILSLLDNGNIGVSTIAPVNKLAVQGGILATSSITAQGGFFGDGSGLTGLSAAAAADIATDLAGGAQGEIPYQTGVGNTAMLAAGTAGQLLQSGGAGAPSWTSAPAIGGASITGLPAANIAAGNLPANVIASSIAVGTLYEAAFQDPKVNRAGDMMYGSLDIQGARLKVIADTTANQYSLAAGTGTIASHLYVSTGGNVGIGTTAPSSPLDVFQNGGLAGANIAATFRAGNNNTYFDNAQIAFGHNGTTDYRHSIRTRHNAGDTVLNAVDFYLWTGADASDALGSKQVMTLEGTGNVGIGITSPGATLDVAGAGNFSGSVTTLSSGTFRAAGASQFSVETSSGILVQAGRIQAPAIQLTNGAAANYVLASDAAGNASWVNPAAGGVGDGWVGNEITDVAADGTLTRSGAGIVVDPYKVGLNLANSNNWTGIQTFTNGLSGSLTGAASQNVLKSGDTMTGQLTSISSVTITGNGGIYGLQVSSNISLAGALYSANGNIGIGVTSPEYALHVNKVNTGAATVMAVRNSDNTSVNSHAYLNAEVGGSGGGNPALIWSIIGARVWAAGVDNNDFDKWKLASNTDGMLNNGTKVTMDTAGNFGIGTTGPSYRLHVSSGAGEAGTIMAVSTGTANLFWVAGDGAHAVKYSGDGSGLTNLPVPGGLVSIAGDTMTGQLTNTSSVTITGNGGGAYGLEVSSNVSLAGALHSANGKVGIGTINPSGRLHVYSAGQSRLLVDSPDDSAQLILNSGATANFVGMTIQTGNTARWSVGENVGTVEIPNFTIYDQAATTSRFYINSTGNIGIGTTVPDQKLTVAGNISQTGVLISSGTGNSYFAGKVGIGVETVGPLLQVFSQDNTVGNVAIGIRSASNASRWGFRNDFTDNNFHLDGYDGASWTDRLTILKSNGNTGIATSAPDQKLTVAGNISQTGVLISSGTGKNYFAGDVTAARYQIGGSTVLAVLTGLSSLGVGLDAGPVSSGDGNLFVGIGAGKSNDSGFSNSFLGTEAGYTNTTGQGNSFVGYYAGRANNFGGSNTFVGTQAGLNNDGDNNAFFGADAGSANSAGDNNVFIGAKAGFNATGTNNIVIGANKDTSQPIANDELNIGGVLYGNLSTKTLGISTRVPQAALDIVSTATAVNIYAQIWRDGSGVPVASMTSTGRLSGDGSGLTGVSGSDATKLPLAGGTMTGNLNLGGMNVYAASTITATGDITAARYQINGSTVLAIWPIVGSLGVGVDAGRLNAAGSNAFLGYRAGYNNTSGSSNIFQGALSGFNNTEGWGNSFMGYQAGYNNTTGIANAYLSPQSGYWSQSGSANNVIGYRAGGYGSGAVNSFSSSTIMGYQAGYSLTNGNDNIFLGFQAGYAVTTGVGNIVIGYSKDTSVPAANNELNIGGVLYGDLSAKTIGISTRVPQAALDIVSTGTVNTQFVQIWRDSSGNIQSSMSATGVMMASRFVGNGSALTGVAAVDSSKLPLAGGMLTGGLTVTGASITVNSSDGQLMKLNSDATYAGVSFWNNNITQNGALGFGNSGGFFIPAINGAMALAGYSGLHLGATSKAALTITILDKVGVGTIAPLYALDVSTANDTDAYVFRAGVNGIAISTGGAIQTTGLGHGSTTGNPRGNGAVELQSSRAAADQVASGVWSTIGGGRSNKAYSDYATVSGGQNNSAGWGAFVGGGTSNTASLTGAVVGGGNGNTASGMLSTIAGGFANQTTWEYSAVGGGLYNVVTGSNSVIGGGGYNTVIATSAVVSGGERNKAQGKFSTLSGGLNNNASGISAAIGGGTWNSATGDEATVSGGGYNSATGIDSTVGGGIMNQATNTNTTVGGGLSNKATVYAATVGGGSNNTAAANYAVIPGGLSNTVDGANSSIAGGAYNVASGSNSAVSGGQYNAAVGTSSVIGGGENNRTENFWSTVGGGRSNTARDIYATVGGGTGNYAGSMGAVIGGGSSNNVYNSLATIGGGQFHTIDSQYGTVAGGSNNKIQSFAYAGFIGGGENNISTGAYSTVGGGRINTSSGAYSAVLGGNGNTAEGAHSSVAGGNANRAYGAGSAVSGGKLNNAWGDYSIVAGGESNEANTTDSIVAGGSFNSAAGMYSAVVGGNLNKALGTAAFIGAGGSNQAKGWGAVAFGGNNASMGGFSFAAGYRSTSSVDGTFTWSDSQGFDVVNNIVDQVMFKAKGGFWVSTGTIYSDPGLYVDANNRVGIGTTLPQKSLQVMTASGDGIELQLQSFTGGDRNSVFFSADNGARAQAQIAVETSGGGGGIMHLMTSDNGINPKVERITILNNGNVGIGAQNPGAKLHVVDGATIFEGDVAITTNSASGGSHLRSSQITPPGFAASNPGCGTTAPTGSVNGTDMAGTITLNTGTAPGGTCMVTVTFNRGYAIAPKAVLITPMGSNTHTLNASINPVPTISGFVIQANAAVSPTTSYSWSYIVIE